jgi:hypothetical protein
MNIEKVVALAAVVEILVAATLVAAVVRAPVGAVAHLVAKSLAMSAATMENMGIGLMSA